MADTRITLKGVRVSYPHLITAQKDEESGVEKFGVALVDMPDNPHFRENKAKVREALIEAGKQKFGETWKVGQGKAKKMADAVDDGSIKTVVHEDKDGKYAEGAYWFNAKSKSRPGMVYPWAEPGTTKPAKVPAEKIGDVFYPGAVVNVSVSSFGYEGKKGKGLSFGINNLQFVKDGVRFDNRTSAEDEFDIDPNAASPDVSSLDDE